MTHSVRLASPNFCERNDPFWRMQTFIAIVRCGLVLHRHMSEALATRSLRSINRHSQQDIKTVVEQYRTCRRRVRIIVKPVEIRRV